MTRIIAELYDALKAAGVSEEQSRAAASAVISTDERTQLVTKADLAELKADLIKWNVGTILAAAGLGVAIARLL